MPASPRQISIHLQSEDGIYRVPSDTRGGQVFRPFAKSDQGGYTSTMETLYDFFINDVPDPDQALRLDPEFLVKLHNHPDVVAAMRKRELTVAQMKWKLVPSETAKDQKLAAKIAEATQYDLKQIPNFEQVFIEMQGAVLDGGRGHEWRWHQEADGSERPVNFKPVHKTRFIFDRMGNMALKTRDLPVWGAYLRVNPPNPDWSKDIPGGKFTYHVYRRAPGQWERPEDEGYIYWGMGEDVTLYYTVTFDLFVWRFEMKWLEKYGLPPTTLYHADNMNPDDVRRIATSLRGEAVRTIPMGPPMIGSAATGDRKSAYYAVQVDDVPSPSFGAFESYYRNRTKTAINNVLLGSAEEQDKSSSGAGGYADHVSRRDSGPQIFFGWDARNIGNTLTHQLIGPMVERGVFKGIPRDYYPTLVMEPKEEKDQEQQLKIVSDAAMLVPVLKTEVYERAGLTQPTPAQLGGEEVVGGEGMMGDPLDALMQGGKGGGNGFGGRMGADAGNGQKKPMGMPRKPVGSATGNSNGSTIEKPTTGIGL